MPPAPSPKRAFAAVLLAALMVLAGPASVLASPQPTPGYSPAFVTEREDGPWEDCIWAAAAMLLDKWTTGVRTVGRERLRGLSGDRAGGSNLTDVRRAFDKIGMPFAFSPNGGASISWNALLDRLAKGGGAILLGDYHKLPSRYGRWDPDFWSRTGTGDDHALYLDRYDRKTGRILVMDPLAPDGWNGEWMPAASLKKFAWRTGGGSLYAAMTPVARVVPPFEGVELGGAMTRVEGSTVQVNWPVQVIPEGWEYRGATLSTEIVAVGEVDLSLPALQATASAPDQSGAPTVGAASGMIQAAIPVPSAAGLYRLAAGLAEPASGRPVAAAGPYAVYVAGPVAGSISVQANLQVPAGGQARLPLDVANIGTESWTDPPLTGWQSIEERQARVLRVVGSWVPVSEGGEPVDAVAGPFLSSIDPAIGRAYPAFERPPIGKITLGPLDLDTGERASFLALVQAPGRAGPWRLVFEIVDEAGRSLALTGSAPAIVAVDVQPAEGSAAS
jgi:hypothetical protein